MNLFQIGSFFRFYQTAVTKYQLHSSVVFELAFAVLEDNRSYYAFRDVETIRNQLRGSDLILEVQDYGTKGIRQENGLPIAQKRSIRSIVRHAASTQKQGQMLFRLVNHLKPKTILELGASLGIGAMYLASAAREAKLISLEGCPALASVARVNLDYLGLSKNVQIIEGPFEESLPKALQELKSLDLVFLDGNHQAGPTLAYFEACLPFAQPKTVFVFDDLHGSADMAKAWAQIKAHARVTLTLDFFEFSLAFIDPDFRVKQHFNIVPAKWKPWRFF